MLLAIKSAKFQFDTIRGDSNTAFKYFMLETHKSLCPRSIPDIHTLYCFTDRRYLPLIPHSPTRCLSSYKAGKWSGCTPLHTHTMAQTSMWLHVALKVHVHHHIGEQSGEAQHNFELPSILFTVLSLIDNIIRHMWHTYLHVGITMKSTCSLDYQQIYICFMDFFGRKIKMNNIKVIHIRFFLDYIFIFFIIAGVN